MVHIATDTTTKREVVGVFVRGQLDLTAASAFREGLARAARASRAVELHLGSVDFIDGYGLSMLMDAIAGARRVGHGLRIVDASRCVCRLIDITDTAASLAPLPGGLACVRAGLGNSADEHTGLGNSAGVRVEQGDGSERAHWARDGVRRPAFKS
jgi:anti-anti-sigma factor